MTTIQTRSELLPTSPAKRNVPRAYGRLMLAIAAAGTVVSPVGAGLRSSVANLHPHMPSPHLWLIQPTVIQVHVLAAVAVLVLGGVMMAARKGARFHRTAGWVWVCLMSLVAGSSLFITGLNGDKWSWIHLISGWTLIALPVGIMAAKRHKVRNHRRAMMGLFYGGAVLAGAMTFIPGRLMWNLFFG